MVYKMNIPQFSLSDYEEEEEDYIEMELCLSPEAREFEFQMSLPSFTSPADDLFFNGRLLPLYQIPAAATPPESPPESCPDDYFIEWSKELNAFIINGPTKTTWINKIKNSILLGIKSLFIFKNSSRSFRKKKIDGECGQRRSFSGPINGSSSSSSSSNLSSFSGGDGRSSSASDVEGSIEAAIAHCKQSYT